MESCFCKTGTWYISDVNLVYIRQYLVLLPLTYEESNNKMWPHSANILSKRYLLLDFCFWDVCRHLLWFSSSFFLSPKPVEKCSFTTWSSLHLFVLSVSRTLGSFLVIPFLLTILLFFSYLNTEKDFHLAVLSNCYLTIVFKNVTSSLTVLCLDHIACLKLLSLREKWKM